MAFENKKDVLNYTKSNWLNRAVPFYEGTNTYKLVDSLYENEFDRLQDVADILDARQIDNAEGKELDKLAKLLGVSRKTDELDSNFRARIKARGVVARSDTTFKSLLNGVATIINVDKDDVAIERTDTAVATIFVPINSLENTNIDINVFEEIAKDLVMAGHTTIVKQRAQNAFTLKDDGDVDDPELGLTADNINTGGALIQDLPN